MTQAERILIAILAVIALLIGTFLYGNYHGHQAENKTWQIKYDKAQLDAQKDHDAMQAKLDKATLDFTEKKALSDSIYTQQLKELTNAIQANAAFGTCHAGSDFVRIYNSVAAGASKDKPNAGARVPVAGGAAK